MDSLLKEQCAPYKNLMLSYFQHGKGLCNDIADQKLACITTHIVSGLFCLILDTGFVSL